MDNESLPKTYLEIKRYLEAMDDEKLIRMTHTAYEDLSNSDPGSEWNEACFAACVLFSDEIKRRNLTLK